MLRQLDVVAPEKWEPVARAINWKKLRLEARSTQDTAIQKRRLNYIEFWKQMAEAHDFGLMCSRMFMFEVKASGQLSTMSDKEKCGECSPSKQWACEYLLAEDLPAWGKSLRSCAAAVLAGTGDRRAMHLLMTMDRSSPKNERIPPFWDVLSVAITEKALPILLEESVCGRKVKGVGHRMNSIRSLSEQRRTTSRYLSGSG